LKKVLLEKYTCEFNDKNIYENIKSYFIKYNKLEIYEHTLKVAKELDGLNGTFDFDMEKCKLGVYLHDIGRVVENTHLVKFCEENNHEFTEGEKKVPSILHQFASEIIARKVFGIKDIEVLNAIECHTTLRSNPTETDITVFLSDKLSWSEKEHQKLVGNMREAVKESKEKAVFCYQEKLFEEKHLLKCYHKWSNESYQYLLELKPTFTII